MERPEQALGDIHEREQRPERAHVGAAGARADRERHRRQQDQRERDGQRQKIGRQRCGLGTEEGRKILDHRAEGWRPRGEEVLVPEQERRPREEAGGRSDREVPYQPADPDRERDAARGQPRAPARRRQHEGEQGQAEERGLPAGEEQKTDEEPGHRAGTHLAACRAAVGQEEQRAKDRGRRERVEAHPSRRERAAKPGERGGDQGGAWTAAERSGGRVGDRRDAGGDRDRQGLRRAEAVEEGEQHDPERLQTRGERHPEAVTGDRKRGARLRFEWVPHEVGGETLAGREPARNVVVVVGVGVSGLAHDRGRRDADEQEGGREEHDPSDGGVAQRRQSIDLA
jgi:hypothetical protein